MAGLAILSAWFPKLPHAMNVQPQYNTAKRYTGAYGVNKATGPQPLIPSICADSPALAVAAREDVENRSREHSEVVPGRPVANIHDV